MVMPPLRFEPCPVMVAHVAKAIADNSPIAMRKDWSRFLGHFQFASGFRIVSPTTFGKKSNRFLSSTVNSSNFQVESSSVYRYKLHSKISSNLL